MSQVLQEFIKDATRAGKKHSEIHAILAEAGWSPAQIKEALSAYLDKDFPVPVPLPKAMVSPRFTALNLFFFIALAVVIYATVAIIFSILDYNLPDGLGNRQGFYYSSMVPLEEYMRSYLALLLAALPLLYASHVMIKRSVSSTRQATPLIRLRLIYLFLFIGGCILLGNLACFINYFLSGELGMRFFIKLVLLTLLVVGAYKYFQPEIQRNEANA